jgi:hypothetical protein
MLSGAAIDASENGSIFSCRIRAFQWECHSSYILKPTILIQRVQGSQFRLH